MESAVQRFLDQLVDLPQNLGHWFGSWAALPWVLMSVAGLATIHEICRRKQQKANRNAMAEDPRETAACPYPVM
jgi:hypothetical protein